MDGQKDTPTQMLWLGMIVPGMICALVVLNLVTGSAYWPAGRHSMAIIAVYTDPWRVTGTIALELGIAAGMVSWFLLANFSRTERLARPGVLVSSVLALLGYALFATRFFV